MRSSKLLGAACAAALLAVPSVAQAADPPPGGGQPSATDTQPCATNCQTPPRGGGDLPGNPPGDGSPGGGNLPGGSVEHKVTLCHMPGPHQVTISVDEDAVAAYKAHGDYLGACHTQQQPSPPGDGDKPGTGGPPPPRPGGNEYVLVCRGGHTVRIRRSEMRPGDVLGVCMTSDPYRHPQPGGDHQQPGGGRLPYTERDSRLVVVCLQNHNVLVFLRDWDYWRTHGGTWGWCRGHQAPIESVPCTPPGASRPAVQPCPPTPCPPEAQRQTSHGPAGYEAVYGSHRGNRRSSHRHGHRHAAHRRSHHRNRNRGHESRTRNRD